MKKQKKKKISLVKGFIKHPPKHIVIENNRIAEQPSLVVTESEIIAAGSGDDESLLAMVIRDDMFTRSRNAVHAIESIILSHEAGYYPPLSIMNWLVSALRQWHDKGGRITMDMAMKLKAPGQTGNAMREGVKEQLEDSLMIELNRLRYMFELTIDESAHMIATRMKEAHLNDSNFPLPKYSADTIKSKYKKNKCHSWITNKSASNLRNASDEEKREVLTHYPMHTYDHIQKIKKYFSRGVRTP